ncbi:putative sugar transporter [Phaeosphaeria sp. MPI-PUGE-AT-0046c]|nr:putative sugar transporter [Phaeosphaeria sp. MPI-PUGE-AT-0046c]
MAIIKQFECFNLRLALGCTLIAFSSFNYGFDNQAFATSQAMDAFARAFGDRNARTGKYALDPAWLSLFNSLNYIGFASGVLIGSWVANKFGRRWCMFIMSIYALGTATIAVTSSNRDHIMAARILNYVYVGMELSVIPAFQSEIVPAPARGLVVGTYQLSLILGGLVINSVCRGTSTIKDNRAWRIPLGLFYIVPSIIAALVFLTPESPRWLLKNGRVDEARSSLHAYRVGKFSQDEIDTEFRSLQYALEHEEETGKFLEIFNRGNLKRTCLVVAINFFQQATGQAFASQYGAIYVKSLGTINPFDFSVILSAINIGSIIITLLIIDRVGRRPMLLIGAAVQTVALISMGSLGTPSVITPSLKIAIVAMLTLMSSGFSIGWAPLTYVVTTEIPALKLRDHTLRLGFFVNVVMNFAVNFSIPYLIYPRYAGLDSKVGFIFGGLAATCFVFTYFCVPECKGKTLEQVDFMFREKVPLRQFGKYQVPELTSEDEKVNEKLEIAGKV